MRATAVRRIRGAIIVGLVVGWALVLRPQWLGGPATYVLVRGDSMLPTYQNGDFLVLSPEATYGPGDIVAYKVPEGQVGAGHLIVHRIRAITEQGFEIRGDNNSSADPWIVTPSDVVGRTVLQVPALGLVLAFLLQPVIAGGLAASGVVMYFVARSNPAKPGVRVPLRRQVPTLR
jgi:signal peptidase I